MPTDLLETDKTIEAMILAELNSLSSTDRALRNAEGDVNRMVESVGNVVQTTIRLIHASSEYTETVNQFAQNAQQQSEGAIAEVKAVSATLETSIRSEFIPAVERRNEETVAIIKAESSTLDTTLRSEIVPAIERQREEILAEIKALSLSINELIHGALLPAIERNRRIGSATRWLQILNLVLVAVILGAIIWLNRAALFQF